MSIHTHTHLHDTELRNTGNQPIRDPHAKAGLWKLLVAAILILLGLVGAMEFFGNGTKAFTTPATPETIVQ